MSARAAIRLADIERAMKAAKRQGFALRIEGGAITLLPMTGEIAPTPADAEDDAWQRAMSKWRKSG